RDTQGQAIEGATVAPRTGTQGINTDANGRFTLQVAQGTLLSVSYIGYTMQEFTVDSRSEYLIVLQQEDEMLDEVVVIGYGTIRKRDLTGSLASVGSDAMKDRPVANIGEAL